MDQTSLKTALDSRQHYAGLVAYVSDAVISLDSEGMITAWNRGAEHHFGWGEKQVIGKSVYDLGLLNFKGTSMEKVLHRLVTDNRWDGEVTSKHMDGSDMTIHVVISPVRKGVTGPEPGMVLVATRPPLKDTLTMPHTLDTSPVMGALLLSALDGIMGKIPLRLRGKMVEGFKEEFRTIYRSSFEKTLEAALEEAGEEAVDGDTRESVVLGAYTGWMEATLRELGFDMSVKSDGGRVVFGMSACPLGKKAGDVVIPPITITMRPRAAA